MDISKKMAGLGALGVAVVSATGTIVVAALQKNTSTTAISRTDTPVVVNRPRDANGSPLPVSVETLANGVPLVIVGNGNPGCEDASPSPSPSPTPSPSPEPSPDEVC